MKSYSLLYRACIIVILLALLVSQESVTLARPTSVVTSSSSSMTPSVYLPFSDDFSTDKGWVNQTSGHFSRDTTNSWLSWHVHRSTDEKYYIPITAYSGDVRFEAKVKATYWANNNGLYFGLAESLTGAYNHSAWPPGLYATFGWFGAGVGNNIHPYILYSDRPDEVNWDCDNPATYIQYDLNSWYPIVFETAGSQWIITAYNDSGSQVGQLAGTLPATHKPFNYFILWNPNDGDWPTGDGLFDDLIVQGVQPDTTPPAAATDLSASTGGTVGTVNLSWTAPGDDDNTGTASTYIVRYHTVQITEANWASSTDVTGEPTPGLAGSAQSMTVSGLMPGQGYYFAIKTQDEVPNTSGISNSPSAVAGSAADTTPPAAITNLSASTGSTAGTVDLSWTAPGDDGNTGTASTYMVRYNTTQITEVNWESSTDVAGEPVPALAGTAQNMTVSSLILGQTYYFAIRTQDEVGNTSALSNSPSAAAQAGSLGSVTIKVTDHTYAPYKAIVYKGQTVVWTNNGSRSHTITEGDPVFQIFLPLVSNRGQGPGRVQAGDSLNLPQPLFDSGYIAQGQTYSYTFNTTGNYKFFSRANPGHVVGMLQVIESGAMVQADSAAGTNLNLSLPSGASLTIPASAIKDDTKVTIIEAPSSIAADDAGMKRIGKAYDLRIDRYRDVIQGPITLTLPYDPALLPSGASTTDVQIASFNGAGWVHEGGMVDPVNHTVTVAVKHLSFFQTVYDYFDCPSHFTTEQMVAYSTARNFIKDIYLSQDIYKELSTLDGRQLLRLPFEGKAAKFLADYAMCTVYAQDQATIKEDMGLDNADGKEVVNRMIKQGTALQKEGADFAAAGDVIEGLVEGVNTVNDSLEILEALDSGKYNPIDPASIAWAVGLAVIKESAFYKLDTDVAKAMMDYGSNVADFVSTAAPKGESDLDYVTNSTQMTVDAVGSGVCTPIGQYDKKFFRYQVVGERGQTGPVWAKGYANLFDKDGKTYFVLGIQDASHFLDWFLIFPDRTDRVYMLLDYQDTDGNHLYRMAGFYNYKSLGINLTNGACLTYVAVMDLPNVADGSEVLVKYIFTDGGALDRRFVTTGTFYPITNDGKRLCYGTCKEDRTGSVRGTVVNATSNQPIKNASVCLQGTSQCATTDDYGIYQIDGLSIGYKYFVASVSGYNTITQVGLIAAGQVTTLNFALTPPLAQGEKRIVLTWGATPADLDSHLWLPASINQHIYFGNEGNCLSYPWTCLDVDDRSGYGPETITIKETYSGKYVFAVNQFSSDGSLISSSAKVQVYDDTGLIATFTVPTSGSGTWWYVFDLDGGTGNLIPKNIITSTSPAPY